MAVRRVPAGEGYGYSNSNYQYLALIAEAVTGERFDALMQARIIGPLNLQATSYNQALEDGDVIHGYGAPDEPERDVFTLIENHGPMAASSPAPAISRIR
ncbi:MAG: serine hydrolase [Oceanicaulis sp.]|nr:serine hydrolase [Oceanicaulis sp.]